MQNSDGQTALGLDSNVGALIAYIPFCFVGIIMSIIILVQDKTNKLPRFHAFQSLLLHGVALILYVGVAFFYGIAIAADSSILGLLATALWFIVVLGILAAVVFCCIKAFQGQLFKLPIIGDMADKWSN